jgi:AcrR family transcriptional regulator
MQRPDEKKRALITATAARLFAQRPFHKVRLEDIAAEAKIGKGTLYIYFDNKEDLYFSLIYDGFSRLVDRLRDRPTPAGGPAPSAVESLERITTELVRFAFGHPHFFELMRTIGAGALRGHPESDWNRLRRELQTLIEDTIRRGVAAAELDDPQPQLTAAFLPGMVRSVMLFGPRDLSQAEVRDQILRLLEHGIVRRKADPSFPPARAEHERS